MNRGFALEIEENYGEDIEPNEFNPAWFQDVDSADFKLNDDIITKSGGSRMDQVARPGVLKPSGSISADVDLQRIIYYFFGLLDNYKCTDNNDGTYIHEFWGGEGKDLKSFRGIAVYDMLVQYLYGIIIDSLKLECSDEKMELSADTIYKTEKSEILNENEEFELPDELENDLFITFYDITLLLNNKKPDGVVNSFDLETKNNLDQDNSIGFGSRAPQAKANARKRENSVSLKTYLTRDTVESILNAKYGKVGAREPEACKLLQIPLALIVRLCEYAELGLGMDLIFPRCTVKAEFDMSGVDEIETTMDLATLGSDNVTLDDGTDVRTDYYVKVVNNLPELGVNESPIIEENPETENISITVQDSEEQPISGATVSIGQISSNTGVAGGCTLQNVPVGTQTIIVTKEGYQEYTDTISISSNDNSFTITLTES